MSSSAWSVQSIGDSRRSSPDADFFVIKRPSQRTFRKLFQSRTPIRCFNSALRIDQCTLRYAKRKIRKLIIRHLDLSKLYGDLPQSRLDFLKREVLLDTELSFMIQYEDGWAVDVLVRNLYFQRLKLVEEKLKLARKTQVWISYSTVKFIAQYILQCHCRRKSLPSCPCVSPERGLISRRTRSASSRIALLSARLDSATPSLLHFHSAIVRAGLCTDEHLRQLFRMTPKSRDKFISQALGKSTLFERVAVMDILGRMNNEL
ncbi:uncharacterized protein HD556DRAFT_3107 [Suillus plorans]|uniref:Uncharacterized protein n=1 Tax=Suillus plorans TaxID=116603 RepID=A0A9P7J9I5_9AGAM|nr:uncharacterized protein HD556DRAFT_3107 [Suillus plorans]KAG1809780.1 hypothetical protein HD556DRAFT_3107 [Suillus plorans]